MSAQEWADQALQSFESVVQASAGFRVREGQHLMARQVAETFARAQLGKPEDDVDEPERAIAVIQAGTGVGKSLAYSVPAIAMALARGTRVLISTATVALQEQLVHKDVPQLAARMEQPFAFALAKGRGRYVCKLKLERLAGGGSGGGDDDLPDDDLFPDEAAQARHPRHDAEARLRFYASLADALAQGGWDGDRDSLDTPPEPEVWSPVAAEASSCTGRHCPLFNQCSYFERRKQLVAAQVIVANHDLLLSSIGARLLPELDNCLLVIDEAHHLPATALDQFACEMDLSRLTWLDKLASRALRIGQLVEVEEIADIPNHTARLRAALQDLARLVMDVYGEQLRAPLPGRRSFNSSMPTRARVSGGLLPDALVGPLGQAAHHADGFLQALSAIAKALKSEMRDKPDEARRLSQLYAQIGSLAPRLEGVHACAQLLLQDAPEGAVPAAKWFTLQVEGDFIVVRAHASPVLPGNTLKNHLWSAVRGAVLTSATLTSCGHFDFFLRESGLHGDAAVTTLAVASPFDYARQGLLVATETQAEPRDAQAFTAEMVDALLSDLALVEAGALVLFTSRAQMRAATEALPGHLLDMVLVQGTQSRTRLLAAHAARVESGMPSVLFGLQSFGEGLDLPGALCETVFIAKLPFAPPSDPVDEARAEWLKRVGRDPFNELVIPATGVKLLQWTGRAIRTEDDHARVICYDKRLVQTAYGRRMLSGLPAYRLDQRNN